MKSCPEGFRGRVKNRLSKCGYPEVIKVQFGLPAKGLQGFSKQGRPRDPEDA